MKRLVECPVSAFIGRDIKDPPQSSYAKEGQLAHECSEIMLEAKLEGRPYPELDQALYNGEMQRCGRAYADYVYGVVEKGLHVDHAYSIEKKVHLDKERDIWGTADFVMGYADGPGVRLVVVDYKYGTGVPVSAEGNWQLATYGLAAAVEFKGTRPITAVECHIFQPRSDHDTPPAIYNLDELKRDYLPKIIETVDRVEEWLAVGEIPPEDAKKYHRAGSWCQFCKAKGICEPYRELHVGNTLELYRKSVEVLPAKQLAKPDAVHGVLSDKELAHICLNASKIKKFVDAAVKGATSIITRGGKIEGLKLIETSGKRSWIDDEAKLVQGLKELGVEEPEVFSKKVKSITAVEQEIGKNKLSGLTKPAGLNYKLVSADDETPAAEFGLDTEALFLESINERDK
jgi:hypothetical protein